MEGTVLPARSEPYAVDFTPHFSAQTDRSFGDMMSPFQRTSETASSIIAPMRASPVLLAGAALCAACGVRIGDPSEVPDGGPAGPDSGSPGPDAVALGPWGTPVAIAGAATAGAEDDGTLASTTNELVFALVDATAGTKDLWYMYRPSSTGAWTGLKKLPFNDATASDETPRFSPDNITLYFASGRAGGLGGLDIYKVTRSATGPAGTWGTPQPVAGVSTTGVDKWFMPCATGNTYLTIVGADIGEGTLGSPPAVSAALSSTTGTETGTFLSDDCLTTYFASTRSGTNQIYVSTRTAIGMPWSTPTVVTDFPQGTAAQEDPWISADRRTFLFSSNAGGTKDVYISTR